MGRGVEMSWLLNISRGDVGLAPPSTCVGNRLQDRVKGSSRAPMKKQKQMVAPHGEDISYFTWY